MLPEPVPSRCLSLVIESIHGRPQSSDRTAIAEVRVLTQRELEPGGAAQVVAEHIARGRLSSDLRRTLQKLGTSAAPGLLREIEKNRDARSVSRLRLALAAIPAAPEQIVEGLLTPMRSSEHEALAEALFRLGDESLPHLEAALARSKGDALGRIAEVLARGGASAILIASLNSESPAHRHELARALSLQPSTWNALLRALEGNPPPASASRAPPCDRTWRSSTPRRRRPFSPRAEALLRPLFAMDGLSYAETYRLSQASAALATDPLLALLLEAQKKAKPGAQTSAIRRAALESLGAPHSELAKELIRAGLVGTDPGERLAALSAASQSTTTRHELLSDLLSGDPWPEVRLGAVSALGAYCNGAVVSIQSKAARSDEDVGVTRTAFDNIAKCSRGQPGSSASMCSIPRSDPSTFSSSPPAVSASSLATRTTRGKSCSAFAAAEDTRWLIRSRAR